MKNKKRELDREVKALSGGVIFGLSVESYQYSKASTFFVCLLMIQEPLYTMYWPEFSLTATVFSQ